jgi:hypothetical protein
MDSEAGISANGSGVLLRAWRGLLTLEILGPSPVRRSGATQIKLTFGRRSWRLDAMIPHAAGGLERTKPISPTGF